MTSRGDFERELASVVSPNQFAALVGIPPSVAEGLLSLGVLEPGQPLSAWIASYCAHLRAWADLGGAGVGAGAIKVEALCRR